MIGLDHLLLTDNLLAQLSIAEQPLHEHFAHFANLVVQATGENGSYSRTGTAARILEAEDAFEVRHARRELRFSYTPCLDASGELAGLVSVHVKSAHQGYETVRALGSFLFDQGGRTTAFRATGNTGPISLQFVHGAMAIVHHYVRQAIAGGFCQSGNPEQP